MSLHLHSHIKKQTARTDRLSLSQVQNKAMITKRNILQKNEIIFYLKFKNVQHIPFMQFRENSHSLLKTDREVCNLWPYTARRLG